LPDDLTFSVEKQAPLFYYFIADMTGMLEIIALGHVCSMLHTSLNVIINKKN
jgi:hypothetical protein